MGYQAAIKEIMRRNSTVTGFSEGLQDELVGGQPSGRKAIRVYVKRKLPVDRLAPEQLLPDEIDGIPVDVVDGSNKKRKKALRAELKKFSDHLERTCGICRKVSDLAEDLARLESLLKEYEDDLPGGVEVRLKAAILRTRNTAADVASKCEELSKEVKRVIRLLPSDAGLGTAIAITIVVVAAAVAAPIVKGRLDDKPPHSSVPPPPTTAAPMVTGISPNNGPAAGGTRVTIGGNDLSGTGSAAVVKFGPNVATDVQCNPANCIVTSPLGSGPVDVTVSVDGRASLTSPTDSFTYLAPPAAVPAVTSLSVSSGPAAGGTQVTVNGNGFSAAPNGTSVKFGPSAATIARCTTTNCTVTSPPGTGTVDLTVMVDGRTSATSSADRFNYQAPPVATPAVSSIDPNRGDAAGGTKVNLTITIPSDASGGVSRILFGPSAAKFECPSRTSCVATSPVGSGTVDVIVTVNGQTSVPSQADQFTYAPPAPTPAVTSLSGNRGPAAGGTRVTVTGTNFSTGLNGSVIRFGPNPATNVTCSTTSCTATSPQGSGTVDVTVTVAGHTSETTAADRFAYAPLPVVTGIDVKRGSSEGGDRVTVTGSNFFTGPNGTTIKFGSNVAKIISCTPTSCTVTSPPGMQNSTVDVTATTADGTSVSNPAARFTYLIP